MDARLTKVALILSVFSSLGATHRTPNFVVYAPSAEIAREVAITAERCRGELAVEWLGKKLPRWYKPCDITVRVGQFGAGGATTFAFDRGEVFGWKMTVQGTLERILDSVIPHEVSHTILACHFRRPLPRWADEGAATLVEHESEQRRQRMMLKQLFNSRHRIPLRKLLTIKEYPRDMQSVLTLYAQGYSLADYLVQQGGKSRYLEFLSEAHRRGWDRALQKHYRVRGVDALEKRWNTWVVAGSPRLNLPDSQQLADANRNTDDSQLVVRSQNPDESADSRLASPKGRPKSQGTGLEAPEPRDERRSGLSNVDSRGLVDISAGRQRALNAGWVPVADTRRPRPRPLSSRQILPTVASKLSRTQRIGRTHRNWE